MSARLAALKDRADHESKTAREVAEKAQADNREMTEDEAATYKKSMASLVEILDTVKTVKADEAVLDQAKAFGAEVGVQPEPAAACSQSERAWARWSSKRPSSNL
jgi:vacuolar-type H+-ATPase subunit E/Vma4